LKTRIYWWALVFAAVTMARTAAARELLYVIAIGNNEPPTTSNASESLPRLRYADDDAAAFASFTLDLGAHVTLLTVLDEDSHHRYRELSAMTKPPNLAELRLVLAGHKAQFERDRQNGDDPILIFFYSGHGSLTGPSPGLSLLDGSLTHGVLYGEVLSQLPARYIHLVVDACHAESVVRPRDAQAEVERMTDEEAHTYATAKTLAGYPSVGAVIATATNAQAHEWDGFGGGVFTHEVLSGLRGAADVNRDGVVEYSELYAFLGAANRAVDNPRARLAVLIRPPPLNPHAPLSNLANLARLKSIGGSFGRLSIEDERGNRIADLHLESGFGFSLAVPRHRGLYARTSDGEAFFRVEQGETLSLDQIRWEKPSIAARGAMSSALARGLFASPFGPVYYRGFIDGHPELQAVEDRPSQSDPGRDIAPRSTSKTPALVAFGIGGAMGISSGILALAAMRDKTAYEGTNLERPAAESYDRFIDHRSWAIGTGLGALASVGIGYWLWPQKTGAVPGGVQAVVTGGRVTGLSLAGSF
jgi:hypothetical protein